MKKLLFVLLVITGVYVSQAQENKKKCKCNENTIIEINPFGENKIPKCVRHGVHVKFKINNVNTFRVNGALTKDTLNFTFDVPSLISNSLQGSETPPPGDSDRGNKRKGNTIGPEAIKEEITDPKKQFINQLKEFVNTYERIQLYSQLQDRLNEKLEGEVFIKDTETFKASSTAYFKSSFEVEDANSAKNSLQQKIQSLRNSYGNLKELYEKLNTNKEDKKAKPITGTLILGGKTIKDVKVTLTPPDKEKILKDEFEFAKKTIDTLLKPGNKVALETKVANGINLYEAIQDADFEEYIDGGQAENDVFSSTITLSDNEGNELHEFEPVKIRTRGGVKVNFSSGYLVSFIGDDDYSNFQNSDGDTAIRQDRSNDLTHALGALVHVYPRGYKDIQPALSAGISLEDDADIGFYLGGSLLFTESNRFVLTAGLSFTNVQRLNTFNVSEVQEDGSRVFLSEENTNANFEDVFRGAFFVGLTFNLSGNNNN